MTRVCYKDGKGLPGPAPFSTAIFPEGSVPEDSLLTRLLSAGLW